MTNEAFLQLAEADVAKRGEALRALWLEVRGDWDGAHATAQRAGNAGDRAGDWVHAYLHRVEGDELNAGHWYARAGRKRPPAGTSFEVERAGILKELWS